MGVRLFSRWLLLNKLLSSFLYWYSHVKKKDWFLVPSSAPSPLFSEEEDERPASRLLFQLFGKSKCTVWWVFSAPQLRPWKNWRSTHVTMVTCFCISFCWKTKDPMVQITLDDYTTIFALTPTGIIRYLRLLKPVDREKQMAYTFTVGLRLSVAIYKTAVKFCDLHLLFCVY